MFTTLAIKGRDYSLRVPNETFAYGVADCFTDFLMSTVFNKKATGETDKGTVLLVLAQFQERMNTTLAKVKTIHPKVAFLEIMGDGVPDNCPGWGVRGGPLVIHLPFTVLNGSLSWAMSSGEHQSISGLGGSISSQLADLSRYGEAMLKNAKP